MTVCVCLAFHQAATWQVYKVQPLLYFTPVLLQRENKWPMATEASPGCSQLLQVTGLQLWTWPVPLKQCLAATHIVASFPSLCLELLCCKCTAETIWCLDGKSSAELRGEGRAVQLPNNDISEPCIPPRGGDFF